MNSRNTDMAKPASTSARSKPKGCRIDDRFHTSKLQNTSMATHIVAEMASKNIRCERAVRANEPCELYSTYPAIRAWQRHHPPRVVCSIDILRHDSFSVGMGREAGRASGARGGGSRKIWCWVEILLCL